ncbi:Uncharacterized protein FKW44_002468 [Caligus rogercresseyi]|uniref:ISXO2-like transposase domain-containing protein n=1 Tax=Caligus rogercresseyi TaxID=217165 RepID=A0A7T8KK93_CALRO|nr:Uncharacterized protein FKW44_002468 [Caligus rogercresseyi]
MSMKEIIEVTSDIESSRQFLQIRGCLRFYPPTCGTCHRPMSLSKYRGGAKRWKCGTHQDKTLNERSGSLWTSSNLSFPDTIRLAWAWAQKMTVKTVPQVLGISSVSAVRWYSIFREICSRKLSSSLRKIGGPGVVVQIDESLMAKRKYNRGHLVPERWVFGGYCPDTKEGFLLMVNDRRAATLLPLIMDNIEAGSIIYSDG